MSSSQIKDLPNYHLIRSFQQRRVKQLNDFYIEVYLTISGLRELQRKIAQMGNSQNYSVPGMRGGKKFVRRKTSDILNYIDRRVSSSEYEQALVFVVAIAEDYISDVIFATLMAYPQKILISAKGKEGERSVDLRVIIEKNDVEQIIVEQAQTRLNEVMYATPDQYSAYFKKVTGFALGNHLAAYIELKATRDLLVHNDGQINSIYLEKAGSLSRGQLGERIIVNSDYFEESVRMLKNISSTIYRGLLDKFGKSAQFAEATKYIL